MANVALGDRLYSAAREGDLETVRALVLENRFNPNFDINYQNIQGNTALYTVCSWGFQSTPHRQSFYYEIVKFLIEHGADVNIANKEGKTPLYIAAAWGHHHVVHLLILHGAHLNPQVEANSNMTPLQIACYTGRFLDGSNFQNFEVFSKHHAYFTAKDYMEHVLTTGEYLGLLKWVQECYSTLVKYSPHNPLADIPNYIMKIIVYYNHFATVKELVHAGADIHALDSNGGTALGKAAIWGNLAIMKLLIENSASVTITDNNGRTIRDLAVVHEQSHVVQFLDELIVNPAIVKLLRKNGAVLTAEDEKKFLDKWPRKINL